MTLRSRLSLFFVAIVVVPLIGAAVIVAALVPRELDERTDERLRGAASAVTAVRGERLERAAREVGRIARDLASLPASARPARLGAARLEAGLDFLIAGGAGTPRTSQLLPGQFLPDAPGLLGASTRLSDGTTVRGGWFTDAGYARRLAAAAGVDVAILDGSRTLAEAAALKVVPARSARLRTLTLNLDGDTRRIVLTAVRPPSPLGLLVAMGGIGALGLMLACLLGMALARAISNPLARLSAQAASIAAGDYTQRVAATGHDEVADLGRTFNAMASSVQAYVGELRQSRDELRGTLQRLGATLKSTGGMDQMLSSVLDAAAAALGAECGSVFRPGDDATLIVTASVGMEAAQATREVATTAMRERKPVLLRASDGDDPLGRSVAAAPLYRGHEVVGVIAIACRDVPQPIGRDELATLASFAAQASVAVDNVLLRQEAERLAVTDPLTGANNRRALETILQGEVDRATRYGRYVSILMIDIDHFKNVNDRFGHLEGDRVLAEAARRIGASIRKGVDVLARYGGEEFVVVLPETPPAGAMVAAAKILEEFRGASFDERRDLRVTVSIGVASVPGDGPAASDVLYAADLALYRAKEGGRDQAVAATAAIEERKVHA